VVRLALELLGQPGEVVRRAPHARGALDHLLRREEAEHVEDEALDAIGGCHGFDGAVHVAAAARAALEELVELERRVPV
jgi:hypothetical protein